MTESIPKELAGLWRTHVVLKQDVFSTVERGYLKTPEGEVQAVLRRIDLVPWWSAMLARLFLAREARAIEAAGSLNIAPRLLRRGRLFLVRTWIDALPLHVSRPEGDARYFVPPSARSIACIARATPTTISPRNRTGCARRTAARC